jgi:hypothetical protein
MSQWSLPDWFSVVGFPLAIIGFVVAWLQLRKTTGAATAARDAIQRTEELLGERQLLILIPRMQAHGSAISSAASAAHREGVIRGLEQWRDAASQVRVLLEHRDPQRYAELIRKLQETSMLANIAGANVVERSADPREGTTQVRTEITSAGDRASEVIAEMLVVTRRDEKVA